MISATLISNIIAGCRLGLATAKYLDTLNSKWRFEEIDYKLDAIRDVHLKAGYQFLKDVALSNTESNSSESLKLAYAEFVKAISSYADRSDEAFEAAMEAANASFFKTESTSLGASLWNKGVDKLNNTSEKENKSKIAEQETNNYIRSLEGLAFCHILRREQALAKDCISLIFQTKVSGIWKIFKIMKSQVERFNFFPRIYYKMIKSIISPDIEEADNITSSLQKIDSTFDIVELPYYNEFIRMKNFCATNAKLW